MSVLTWDGVGERLYETGVDHGVLYVPDNAGAYVEGFAWNGLTAVTEKPSGAEPNAQFADNIKYLNLFSAEEFAATLEAFTYPDEFAQFDGLSVPSPGITIGQQARGAFGLSYRTKVGNDVEGDDLGYKIHLIYGCKASPSEKAYATINDSPEAIVFSWEISTTPALVTGLKPTSIITIDSRTANAGALAALELILYGDVGVDPALPTPDAVIALFDGTFTTVNSITSPTYNSTTDIITIPTVTGVTFYIDDVAVPAGSFGPITANTLVTARPDVGYVFAQGVDDDWLITFA